MAEGDPHPDDAMVVRCGLSPFLGRPLHSAGDEHPSGYYEFSVQAAVGRKAGRSGPEGDEGPNVCAGRTRALSSRKVMAGKCGSLTVVDERSGGRGRGSPAPLGLITLARKGETTHVGYVDPSRLATPLHRSLTIRWGSLRSRFLGTAHGDSALRVWWTRIHSLCMTPIAWCQQATWSLTFGG
jgi:hypothetical protein